VAVADLSGFSAPSAKSARALIEGFGTPRRMTLVLAAPNENIWKSFRNFPGVAVCFAADLCAHDVVNGGMLVAERGAIEALATRVGTSNTTKGAAK
jgi:hypothetical protein